MASTLIGWGEKNKSSKPFKDKTERRYFQTKGYNVAYFKDARMTSRVGKFDLRKATAISDPVDKDAGADLVVLIPGKKIVVKFEEDTAAWKKLWCSAVEQSILSDALKPCFDLELHAELIKEYGTQVRARCEPPATRRLPRMYAHGCCRPRRFLGDRAALDPTRMPESQAHPMPLAAGGDEGQLLPLRVSRLAPGSAAQGRAGTSRDAGRRRPRGAGTRARARSRRSPGAGAFAACATACRKPEGLAACSRAGRIATGCGAGAGTCPRAGTGAGTRPRPRPRARTGASTGSRPRTGANARPSPRARPRARPRPHPRPRPRPSPCAGARARACADPCPCPRACARACPRHSIQGA
jgi:hypothetical protein